MVNALAAALLLATVPATAPGHPSDGPRPGVLDLYLARMEASYARRGPYSLPAAFPKGLAPTRRVAIVARAVTVRAAPLLAARIRELGGSATIVSGAILDASIPLAALGDLADSPLLARAEADLGYQRMLDKSVPAIGADRVQRGDGLAKAITGKGVVLGLIDTGLDYRHPAFKGDDGYPRVRALWDQNASSGTPPAGYTGGNLCTAQDIRSKKCDAIDLIGHGTHVAATAGGRDRDYQGVAPDVDYVVVRSLAFQQLGASAKWIFETADGLGEPAVINMSLGGHYGAHDGTSLEEEALDGLVGAGHLIAVAAGNEGADDIHLGYTLSSTPEKTELLLHPGFQSSGGFVDLWVAQGGTANVEVTLEDRSGNAVGDTGVVSPADSFDGTFADASGTSLGQVQVVWAPANAENGKIRANVVIVPTDTPNTFSGNPSGYRWILTLTGDSHFDAWISSGGFLSPPATFGTHSAAGWEPADSKETVAMPGTAPGVITVAAWSTKNAWTDIDGNHVQDDTITLGDIAFFSSRGPSADPSRTGQKPDITAPGQYIAAPFGYNAFITDRHELIAKDVVAFRGTSMATPHVAGTLALMLQAKPTLTPDQARKILDDTAKHDSFTGPVPNDRWGYGKLDAYAAVRSLVGPAESPGGGGGSPGCGCSAAASSGGAGLFALLLGLALVIRRR